MCQSVTISWWKISTGIKIKCISCGRWVSNLIFRRAYHKISQKYLPLVLLKGICLSTVNLQFFAFVWTSESNICYFMNCQTPWQSHALSLHGAEWKGFQCLPALPKVLLKKRGRAGQLLFKAYPVSFSAQILLRPWNIQNMKCCS